ncbi:TldD/PmbA family protein [bacterium]|nr:TldD/PmbA family protein [bacterium]
MKTLTEQTANILKMARQAGADQAEVYAQQSRNTVIGMSESRLEEANVATTRGFGLKFIRKNRLVFIDSSDFSPASVRATIDRAAQLVALADEDPYVTIAPAMSVKRLVDLNDPTLLELDFDQKVAYLHKIDRAILEYDPKIEKASGISYQESISEIVIANTNGLLCSYPISRLEIEAGAMAHVGNERQEGDASRTVHFFRDLPKPVDLAREAAAMAVELIGGKPVETQQVPVVFDANATWSIIRYGIFEAIKGDRILQKSSYLDGRLGQCIASPLVTIIDDGTMIGGIKSVPCDDEGTPTERKILVDKGILKQYVYDLSSAKRAGTQPTGNAFRRSYRNPAEIHSTNLYLEKGDLEPKQIIAAVPNGLWVRNTIGFGVDSITGTYSMGAAGRWIKDGVLTSPVSGVTIAASLDEILLGIEAVGNDLIFRHETASPTFRVKAMTVSGISG